MTVDPGQGDLLRPHAANAPALSPADSVFATRNLPFESAVKAALYQAGFEEG